MNEAETRAEHIDPALKAAGWGVVEGSRVQREYPITKGRLEGFGRRAKPLTADYLLVYRNTKLAVIEAKAWSLPASEGLAQAKNYAEKLAVRFAYSTNGQSIYCSDLKRGADLKQGAEGETQQYPTPEELWTLTFAEANTWRDRFAAIPFEDKGGAFEPRYYQDIAVARVLAAISQGQQRILLTLATGTGKTSIAFQIAWKLFHARWNLSRQPLRQPRVLFLADRNILASQAMRDFSAFGEDGAMARIEPEEIRKKGKVPKNASIFFTIFQTFLSGPPKDGQPSPYFGEYPPDFFDLIIVDECHRGGANDESTWRDILDYFSPAVQLGLTATPKRRDNVDTYAYFGEPVYIYSLKDGINDGYLTPFKVKQISTTLDEYIFTPDDTLVEGEVEAGRRYTESDFNRIIEIKERERHRVQLYLAQAKPSEKAIVFCATQDHALAVRDLINQLAGSSDPNYCQRVTANDGALGEQHLKRFQDNEYTIPTVLTTSQKLSTGVDAKNIRNIVLMRPVNSMIEFKQIIGRGTRLYEGKDYFTIYDFVQAYHHFNDPEWDGEPLEPEPEPTPAPRPPVDPDPPPSEPGPRPQKIKILLADGKARTIQHMMSTSFWHPDGTPMSAQQFMTLLFGQLPGFFADESELRSIWSVPDTRVRLLEGLAEKGFGGDQMAEIQRLIAAENSDLFDVLAYIAYAVPPVSRNDRAAKARLAISREFNKRQQAFLDFVLSHYVTEGVQELSREKLPPLLRLRYRDAISEAVADLGKPEEIGVLFTAFQKFLYQEPTL